MKSIGFVHSGKKSSFLRAFGGIYTGLGIEGFEKDVDYTIRDLWAEDSPNDLRTHITSLVTDDTVDVVIAAGGPGPAQLAKQLTQNQPIKKPVVFTTVVDPPGLGLVGDNLTGMAGQTSELDDERLRLLFQLLQAQPAPGPGRRRLRLLFKRGRAKLNETKIRLRNVAGGLNLDLDEEDLDDVAAIDIAFEKALAPGHGLVVTADSMFNNQRRRVVNRAAQLGIPAIYQWREFVEIGGLMSYGPSILEAYVFAGVYAGRILKGADPATIPLSKPTHNELVINRTTAAALKLIIPPAIKNQAEMID